MTRKRAIRLSLIALLACMAGCSVWLLSDRSHMESLGRSTITTLAPQTKERVSRMRSEIRAWPPQAHTSKKHTLIGSARSAALTRLDDLWIAALKHGEGDLDEALFIAAASSMTHRYIPIRFGIEVPLTFEGEPDYAERVRRLPRYLFEDTPPQGDADKLQHFFGSAWLAGTVGNSLAVSLGEAIEQGEGIFINSLENDDRDRRANELGRMFREALAADPSVLPSAILRQPSQRLASNATSTSATR